MLRKRRTREHVIADLSVDHVERFILRQGHTSLAIVRDYGYDLAVFTHDENGEPEGGNFFVQLKATDHPKWHADGETLSQILDTREIRNWRLEVMPVILVVYDATQDRASWLYVQRYLRNMMLAPAQESITLHLSRADVVDEVAIDQFRRFVAAIVGQSRGAIRHDAG